MKLSRMYVLLGLCASTASFVACSDASPSPAPTTTDPPQGNTPPATKPPTPSPRHTSHPSPVNLCDPAPAAGELYALSAVSLGGADDVSMCRFRGSVLLVVNVASACGYTPQYAPLQQIYDDYSARGFDVLGFPCNQFGGQEPGSDQDISTFCTTEYHITFPMFSKIEVNGANTHPIYQWLKAQPGGAGDITWNFNKFLIGRDGKLIKRFDSAVTPDSAELRGAIEAALSAR